VHFGRPKPCFDSSTLVCRDYIIKKIQDNSGADIDVRDTVVDILGAIEDPNQRIIQVLLLQIGREDTAPVDSHLHPPLAPPTREQLDVINRSRFELRRYGSTLDTLDPDHPVDSHEKSHTTPCLDKDGFAIPAKINRPSATRPPLPSQIASSSQPWSQDSYESHLVRSPELGSPDKSFSSFSHPDTPTRPATTPSQYSTFEAVPSAQKPSATVGFNVQHAGVSISDDGMDLDITDPISEDSQPRLSNSLNRTPARSNVSGYRKDSDAAETPETGSKPRLWSEEEMDNMLEGLAQDLSVAQIKQRYFPYRSLKSVRHKASIAKKSSAADIIVRKASLSATWTDDEEAHFERAVRNRQSWKTLRDRRFLDRSDDSVKYHLIQVKRRLEKEDAAKALQTRHEEQLKHGQPSTGPDAKFTQEDDDLLLACRIEQVEMKRAAKEFFPLRDPKQVTSRANNLYQDAKRTAVKANPVDPPQLPSVKFLFEHDAETRDRIADHLLKARQFKERSNKERSVEFEESLRQKTQVSKDKERADERRTREEQQRKVHNALEEANERDKRVTRRRLNEDIRRNEEYKQQLVVWEKQSALDAKAGRPIQPRPNPPLGSSIGTEVLSSTPTDRLVKSRERSTATASPVPGPSTASQTERGTKRRRSSKVDVQVVIPVSSTKKQKVQTTTLSTPQQTLPVTKSASTSKVVTTTTPTRTSTWSAQSAMAKLASTREHTPTQDKKGIVQNSPAVVGSTGKLHRISATRPAKSGIARQENVPPIRLSPTAKNARQPRIGFLRNSQQRPSAKKPIPAFATPRQSGVVDDSAYISSDEESSYGDKEITDEELNAAAERSEAMYSSSPAKSILEKNVKICVPKRENMASSSARAMRSSPPVASLPTPKATLSHNDLVHGSLTDTLPTVLDPAVTVVHSQRDSNHQEIIDADAQHDALNQSDSIMAKDEEVGDGEEDTVMIDDGHDEVDSTPASSRSSVNAGAQDGSDVILLDETPDLKISTMNDDDDLPGEENADQPSPRTATYSDGGNSHADERQLREELVRSTQPPENSSAQVLRESPILQPEASKEDNVETLHSLPSLIEVEKVEGRRSESVGLNAEEDGRHERSDEEMPSPGIHELGRSTLSPAKLTLIAASSQSTSKHLLSSSHSTNTPKQKGLKETALEIPSALSASSNISASSPVQSGHISKQHNTSPRAQNEFDLSPEALPSGEKSRRRSRHKLKKKRSRILADAHVFAPPTSTAPASFSRGSLLRKQGKKAVEDENDMVATNSDRLGSPRSERNTERQGSPRTDSVPEQSAKAGRKLSMSKAKRRSLDPAESLKNMVEKAQALTAHTQAKDTCQDVTILKLASTQPVKRKGPSRMVLKEASSQPTTTKGRVVNPRGFEWDDEQDSAELHQQANQRLRDAANMAPKEFWEQSNLKNMNEEQVLSHMIEQGVRRSRDRNWLEQNQPAAGQLDGVAFGISATQPIKGSMDRDAATSIRFTEVLPLSATQPTKSTAKDSDDGSSSSDDSDSEEEDAVTSLSNLARRGEADRKKREQAALPHWLV
jgi:hypothetical protein